MQDCSLPEVGDPDSPYAGPVKVFAESSVTKWRHAKAGKFVEFFPGVYVMRPDGAGDSLVGVRIDPAKFGRVELGPCQSGACEPNAAEVDHEA